MATVEHTVRESILAYPTLFNSRTSVLHHILCVIGNGFDWIGGEAVSTDDYRKPWTAEDARRENEVRLNEILGDRTETPYDKIRDGLRHNMDIHVVKSQEVVDDIDRLVHLRTELDMSWVEKIDLRIYPQSDYALLMNVPADITPDWSEAVAEMREYAAAHGWIFPDPTPV